MCNVNIYQNTPQIEQQLDKVCDLRVLNWKFQDYNQIPFIVHSVN